MNYDYAIKKHFLSTETFTKLNKEANGRTARMIEISKDSDLAKEIILNIEKYFDYKPKKITALQHTLTCNVPTFHPHVDRSHEVIRQIIIYIRGKEKENTGTGFFEDKYLLQDEYKPIDIIGFEENKAIFWNSKMVHAPAHIAKWGLWRYAIIGYFN